MPHAAFRIIPLLVVLAGMPASAHSTRCFATVEGTSITGYAWTGGGNRPKNVPYKVSDPATGLSLHSGTTNERGEFSFPVKGYRDHLIVVRVAEGHEARFTIGKQELPPSLAPDAGIPATSIPPDTASSQPGEIPVSTGTGTLEQAISQAVSREIGPLRRELAEFQDRQRLQDIVAGLGYIAGLCGIAFYGLGKRGKGRP